MCARDGLRQRVAGYALWIFDFDNTLAPLEPAVDWVMSRHELQAWLGAQGMADAPSEEFPRGSLAMYEALRARLCAIGDAGPQGAAPLARASAIIERHELANVEAVGPARGAIELLDALHTAGAGVAIVTSNSSRTVAVWLSAWNATETVDLIVGRDSGLALKPSPAMIERALAAFGATPADAAFAGDSDADLNAANAAGVCFYGISAKARGRRRLTALGAALLFSSPAEMATHLGLQISRKGRGKQPKSGYHRYWRSLFRKTRALARNCRLFGGKFAETPRPSCHSTVAGGIPVSHRRSPAVTGHEGKRSE
jgi:phosphoglycolate phosphatase-like HAD superfamily hydrolase